MDIQKIKILLTAIAIILFGGVIAIPFFYPSSSKLHFTMPSIEHLPFPPSPEVAEFKPAVVPPHAPFEQLMAERPLLDAKPVAFKVQIKSSRTSSQTLELIQTLRDNGFQAYMEGKQYSKALISVGPFLKKERAEAIVKQLYERYKLEGRVVPFEPISVAQNFKENTP
ncbi:MAG: hypothetical protein HY559_05965 [Gammaproteobacteria bacterium]|nr:hypothetical protein [Gammaproteobacteria bacterium]